jgi:CheY-like chemotaxis protein
MLQRGINILLIEDDLDDTGLLEDMLRSQDTPFTMEILNDGEEAVKHFRAGSSFPDLVILDFNLPKIHGRDVVLEMKSLPAYKDIPLLVLTTSSAPADIEFAHHHGVDKYLTKPSTLEAFRMVVDTIVKLATRRHAPPAAPSL